MNSKNYWDNSWVLIEDGPQCTANNHGQTYITRTKEDGWPILVCQYHDLSVCAGGRPIPLVDIFPTATARLPEDAAWYLPQHRPDNLNNLPNLSEAELRTLLIAGQKQYKRAHKTIIGTITDWVIYHLQYKESKQ